MHVQSNLCIPDVTSQQGRPPALLGQINEKNYSMGYQTHAAIQESDIC
jgi:hypothetical protein